MPQHKTYDTHHRDQSPEILRKATVVEDEFLDSEANSLGLEMLGGDDRRRGWGRLIRAPLKRKGHVLLDYCSAGCGGGGGGGGSCPKNKSPLGDFNDDLDAILPDGSKGRITRHKVSRGWSARAAPGS